LEAYASNLWDYVDLTGAVVGTQTYRTYENIDAVMLGFNLSGSWTYLDILAGYTWASNSTADSALTEIPPVPLITTVKIPVPSTATGSIRHTYNDAQTRIDRSLNETPTGAWHRLDVGLTYRLNQVKLAVDVTNLTDELYYQHLSYLRNPFATGLRVYEPGRTVRINLLYMSDLGGA